MALCFLRKRFRHEVREHLPRQEEGERPDRRFHHIQSSDLWYVIHYLKGPCQHSAHVVRTG